MTEDMEKIKDAIDEYAKVIAAGKRGFDAMPACDALLAAITRREEAVRAEGYAAAVEDALDIVILNGPDSVVEREIRALIKEQP